VAKVAKPGQTDRPTEFAIAVGHLVDTKCHKNYTQISDQVICSIIHEQFKEWTKV